MTALNDTGESPRSKEVSATPGSQPLPGPVLTGKVGNRVSYLKWTPVAGALRYNLYRSDLGLYQYGLTGTGFNDTNVTNGQTYYYYMNAAGNDGEGSWSNTLQLTPGVSTLPAPTGLKATAQNGSVYLTWNIVPAATHYYVYRSTTPGGEGNLAVQNVGPGYQNAVGDGGLANGTTYYYKVTALNDTGESPRSKEVSATPGSQPLPGPVLTGKVGNRVSYLKWTPVAGALRYNLYRSDLGLYQYGLTGTGFNDTNVTNGQTYYYYMNAAGNDGEGSWSNTLQLTPGVSTLPAPTGLKATAKNGSVYLTWNIVPAATHYYVYRSTTPGGEGNLAVQNVGPGYQNAVGDGGLANGTTYYYKVTALNDTGESPRSKEVSATPGSQPLPGPVLTGKVGNRVSYLKWTPVAGALRYNLYRSDLGLYQYGLTGTGFNDTNVTNGQTNYYYMNAAGNDGEGSWSNTLQLTPGVSTLPAPTGLKATAQNGSVYLTWNIVPAATHYYVYRSTTPGGEGNLAVQNVGPGYQNAVGDGGLANGTTYYYKVTALNDTGESPRSKEVSATPQ